MTPCNPEKVRGYIPFSTKSKSKRISSQYTNQRNSTEKSGSPTTAFVNLKCLSILFLLKNTINYETNYNIMLFCHKVNSVVRLFVDLVVIKS